MGIVKTSFPDSWIGEYVICFEYGVQGTIDVWSRERFPKVYESRKLAQKDIDESGFKGLRSVIVERDYPYVEQCKSFPKVGVGVVIFKNNKILLGKRKGSHGAGEYSVPGGHLEFLESFEGCCNRETFEETGIKIKNISQYACTNDMFFDEETHLHYVTLFFKAEWDSGEPTVMEPEKCEGWNWYPLDGLPDPIFLPLQNLLRQEMYR